jgi:hypothetical protein
MKCTILIDRSDGLVLAKLEFRVASSKLLLVKFQDNPQLMVLPQYIPMGFLIQS